MNDTDVTFDGATFSVELDEREVPTGWLCPRCGAINAPDVKRCECEPRPEDIRYGTLLHTVVGPKETK